MANYQLNKTQIIERGIPEKIAEKDTLTTMAEIAAYMGCGISKVKTLIMHHGLPAAFVRGSYFTTKENVRQWVQQQHLNAVEQYNWDRRLNKRQIAYDVAKLRGRYGPRPTEPQKRTRLDVPAIVDRIKKT